jgi:hypothetical protein
MKKPTILLLLMVSTSVFAEWKWVGESSAGFTAYVDIQSIRKKGNIVEMWDLYDYKTLQTNYNGSKYFSSIHLQEYDCEEDTTRGLRSIDFSANMRGGNVVYMTEYPEPTLSQNSPGSLGAEIWKFACGK